MSAGGYDVTAGSFYPLGATPAGDGVNFALFSRNATAVWLHLYDGPDDATPRAVIPVENRTRFVWHCRVAGLRPGQLYGYKVDGPYQPDAGHRFNKYKLLLDPYAKAVTGKFDWSRANHAGYDPASPAGDLSFDARANDAGAPRAVVVDDGFDWRDDRPPDVAPNDLIIYELHLKGFTAHPSSGVRAPGTYRGVIEKIPYLRELGVNAVEFLPVHECYVEGFLRDRGLTNYWGYNTIGFFAPDGRFAAGREPGAAVREFKEMVRALHAAGIEVILDVVFNHTGEGNHLGPTLSFRGLDNASYYALVPGQPRYYVDYTGCGNSLNFDEPQVVKLVMDSLRYWVDTMRVDGFRFDLASTLGREHGRFDLIGSFFMAVHQDPVISRVKLIAEPWDIGPGSYQVGNFPVDWSEWNGRWRDTLRRFIKGDGGLVGELAYRLAGSSDLYGDDGRTPYNSVNFATCHDGFTLHDLVSYGRKHNEANGEGNRDGTDDNNSWNWGAEGETDDPAVNALRRRVARNFFALLMVSQGLPMVLGGDEFLRTQRGDNNGYCQDNELSWFDWRRLDAEAAFAAFCRRLIALRRHHPALRRKTFFTGADRTLDNIKDITWYDETLGPPAWKDAERRRLAFLLQGGESAAPGERADDLFVIVNAHWEGAAFKLPAPLPTYQWFRAVDTALAPGDDARAPGDEEPLGAAESYAAAPRSVVILVGRPAGAAKPREERP